jgi:hypothetical protein
VKRNVSALLAMLVCAACASKPPAAPPEVAPAAPSFEQKMSWILRLEDQRQLRDPANAPPPAGDLVALLRDPEGRIRRRAALAIGRVHLPAGIVPLANLLTSETDEEVRQIADRAREGRRSARPHRRHWQRRRHRDDGGSFRQGRRHHERLSR